MSLQGLCHRPWAGLCPCSHGAEEAWLEQVGAVSLLLPTAVYVVCVRMAEQEPTAEQLAQIAAENEEDEHSVNYKPPAQKSIQEIQELDKDDESLRKYKEALLGAVTVSAGEPRMGLCFTEAAAPSVTSCLLPAPSRERKDMSVLPVLISSPWN